MRLAAPRITPLSDAELTSEQAEALEPCWDAAGNIWRTLAHKPQALSRFIVWARYFFRLNDLPPRVRQIVILRTGFLCKSGYEWGRHVVTGVRAGLTKDEIARLKQGAQAGWNPADAVVIQAADELHRDCFITDDTWAELRRHYTEKQCMDVVLTAGQYTQVSMMLNTFGVQLEEGFTLDPDLKRF